MKEIRISLNNMPIDLLEVKHWIEQQDNISGAVNWEYEYLWARMTPEQYMMFQLTFPGWGAIH